MKTVGLITEYNPFHNGHLYHLKQALALSGADTAIAVMSGSFIQRGAPALMSKYERAESALLCGVSAVFELPVCCACQSAEYFAEGAVSLLDELGCVDSLCFGCETDDLDGLMETADLLLHEPAGYRLRLKEGLKNGLSFPLARQEALKSICPSAAALLTGPNNILAVEYLKALKKRNSPIRPFALKRRGSGYHEETLSPSLSSATAIRKLLTDAENSDTPAIDLLQSLSRSVPDPSFHFLTECWKKRGPVETDDFSLLLKNKLLFNTPESLTAYADVSQELSNRIYKNLDHFLTFSQFTELLKTKELAHSRISRALFHILLENRQTDLETYRKDGWHYYARLLGFRKDHAALLTRIKESSPLPIVTSPARAPALSPSGEKMLRENLYATALYESVLTDKFHRPCQNEKRRKLILV